MDSDTSYLCIDFFTPTFRRNCPLPYADAGIQAGFPSPAQDFLTETIDLNRELIHHPAAATFYGRVSRAIRWQTKA